MRTRILGPLGMTRTGITLSDDMRSRLAAGHHASLSPTSNWDLPTLAGAGALRSTANDMLLFLDAAMGRRPSPLAAAFAAMLATREKAGNSMEVGLGWHPSAGDTEIIWRNGGTGGYRSWMGHDPKSRSGVVVLTNAGTRTEPDDLGMHLISRTPLLPTFPPAAHRQRFAPRRRWRRRRSIATWDAISWRLRPSLLSAATAAASSHSSPASRCSTSTPRTHEFFFKIVDAQLTFETDAQGKAQAVVLHQNGANQRAPRIEGDRLPQRRSRWPPASSIDTSGGISSFRASSSASAGREQD